MAKVFISYRRADSGRVSRINDGLVAHFGRENVFFDVGNFPLGVSLADFMQQVLARCRVALVVIGPSWLAARDSAGNRRLDDPNDLVRVTIETAMVRGLSVIPVLVDGATMPRADSLPPTLERLAFFNAVAVRNDRNFQRDVDQLIAIIEREPTARRPIGLFGERESPATPTLPPAQPTSSVPAAPPLSPPVPTELTAADAMPVVAPVNSPVQEPVAAAVTLFISYSRTDETTVNRLRADLGGAGAVIWIDHEQLKPGTDDWEEAVRAGIVHADAVVFMASPDARKSQYVRDEIAIARNQHKSVYPFWVVGEDWHDCVPLGWGATQYADGRGTRYDQGLRELLASLGLAKRDAR